MARVMVEAGRGGSIISFASIEGVWVAPSYASYAAAKAGMLDLTKTLALEPRRTASGSTPQGRT